jgi:hypothetical protein
MRTASGLRTTATVIVLCSALAACFGARDRTPPFRLSDEEFRRLSTGLSEPGGDFHTDNLVSNELSLVQILRELRSTSGVYIGVGPEQNFSYIAALDAEMAFIIDIRQANRTLHLLYKVLFEASVDRAEFLSRLFSRERPAGLDGDSTAPELFAAYATVTPSAALLDGTTQVVTERLRDAHGWPLSVDERAEIARVLRAFFEDGPDIHYDRSRPPNDQRPSYRALMTATDQFGVSRSYLASEDRFASVKDLHARNLIVPAVGDFGAGAVIRRVAEEVGRRGRVVSAFYSSNVEVYLTNQQMIAFCGSLTALPWSTDGVFIDSKSVERLTAKLAHCPPDRRPFEGWRRNPGTPK